MPEKITPYNLPILIHESDFEKAEQAINANLEGSLKRLMEHANQRYDMVYRAHKNNPDIEKFSFCRQNYNRIKFIIESKENPTQLNTLYLEAWVSLLYSDVHALNLEPETKDDLNKLIEKIQIIGIDFKQLITKKSGLDSNNEDSIRLLNYIDVFEYTWKTKKKRLLADSHYNFAETLVENSDFPKAINYFEKSITFYKNAAVAANEPDKAKFFTFAEETNKRLEEIKAKSTQSKRSNLNNSGKKLNIRLQRLPNSISEWSAINEGMLSQSTNAKETDVLQTKRKRESLNEEPIHHGIKKIKQDSWTIERKKILDKFVQLNLNVDLAHLSNNKKSFDERRAIIHNNHAIFLIEDLNNTKKNYSNNQKITALKKAKQLLKKSAEFYKKANLSKEKDSIMQCINILSSSLENLEIEINQISNRNDCLPIKTQKPRIKPTIKISGKKFLEYQTILSTRLAYKFFNASLSENNTQNTNPQNKKDSSCLSLTRSNE